MSSTTSASVREPLNGIDVAGLFATLDHVKAQPELAEFRFRARNEWVSGTHSRTTIQGFFGAGQEDTSRSEAFGVDTDHPAVLAGTGQGPTAVELLLAAIAACLTSGIGNIAAARGVTLHRVASTVEGDIDLAGMLGIDPGVRNGYRQIRTNFEIEGDASAETLAGLVEQSRKRSAVYDVLVNGVDVVVDVQTPSAS